LDLSARLARRSAHTPLHVGHGCDMRVPSLKIEAYLLLMVWKSHETSTSAYIGNGVDILHVLAQGHVSDILNRRHAYLFISFILSALLSPQHS